MAPSPNGIGAIGSFNLLVVLGAHVPDVRGDIRPFPKATISAGEDALKRHFQKDVPHEEKDEPFARENRKFTNDGDTLAPDYPRGPRNPLQRRPGRGLASNVTDGLPPNCRDVAGSGGDDVCGGAISSTAPADSPQSASAKEAFGKESSVPGIHVAGYRSFSSVLADALRTRDEHAELKDDVGVENITTYICQQICSASAGGSRIPDSERSDSTGDGLEDDTEDTLYTLRNLEPTPAVCKPAANSAERRITLVMSRDNIAALILISSLSILGTIYLWKICTRRNCSCRLCRNQYRTLHLLGSGGYGSVYLVDRLEDHARFVSKKIPIREITEADEYSREAKELILLRHRHIVSYEDDFVHVEHGGFEPKTFFIIIMEYCPEGDLKEKIETDFHKFTEEWVRNVFAQLVQAVQYLHSKNVIHRDLKSQNVFLAADGLIRLGDFGLCRHTRANTAGFATLSHAGTDCYMAPEIFASGRYGKPADMWSMGCVLYELCTGVFMWELDGILAAMLMKDSHAVQKLLQENLVPCVGNALSALLRRLLSSNPASRPTATDCIRKRLFKRGFALSRERFGKHMEAAEPSDATNSGDSHVAKQEFTSGSPSCDGKESGGSDGAGGATTSVVADCSSVADVGDCDDPGDDGTESDKSDVVPSDDGSDTGQVNSRGIDYTGTRSTGMGKRRRRRRGVGRR
eukprot:TRINITY_DN27916_c0_g1_i1.p1 TRINITY_DN27916_c0_g1~~TRINITY_DN27916_c0_g1_i1.p1  ORF type:complete len:705 (-),score=135.83 TRINITY_DN27916_c0_g1_i1:123-2189(-)